MVLIETCRGWTLLFITKDLPVLQKVLWSYHLFSFLLVGPLENPIPARYESYHMTFIMENWFLLSIEWSLFNTARDRRSNGFPDNQHLNNVRPLGTDSRNDSNASNKRRFSSCHDNLWMFSWSVYHSVHCSAVYSPNCHVERWNEAVDTASGRNQCRLYEMLCDAWS